MQSLEIVILLLERRIITDNCDIGSEKRDHFALNAKFYRFSNTHHSDRLHSWFTCSSGLLLTKIQRLKLEYSSSMKGRRFEEWPISYRVIAIARHAHTGCGCGAKFPASFARCLKNTHTKFEACSYNSFRHMRDLSQNFRFSAKWSLFSYPVTIGFCISHNIL